MLPNFQYPDRYLVDINTFSSQVIGLPLYNYQLRPLYPIIDSDYFLEPLGSAAGLFPASPCLDAWGLRPLPPAERRTRHCLARRGRPIRAGSALARPRLSPHPQE